MRLSIAPLLAAFGAKYAVAEGNGEIHFFDFRGRGGW